MNHPVPPEFPGTKLPTKELREEPMAPAAYVAEDELVGHQREESPESLVLRRINAPV